MQAPVDTDKLPLPFRTDNEKFIIEARYGSIRTFSKFIQFIKNFDKFDTINLIKWTILEPVLSILEL